jgi:uncharacterized membrane protein HdeD (DUF308 family)
MRTRRVGTLTCGILLVIIGILCLVHIFWPALHYEYILRGWPIILILVGVEMLAANAFYSKAENVEIKYDLGAILLIFILVIFATCMGMMEYAVTNFGEYLQWTW